MLEMNQIVDNLWLAGTPRWDDIKMLRKNKIQVIVSTHVRRIDKRLRQEFKQVYLPWVDLVVVPQPLWLLERGVEAILPHIEKDEAVLVHCRAGRHRSVALVGCTLVAMGMKADEAMKLIKKQRLVADPDKWHIQRQIRKFEKKMGKGS
jgi:protein-tyrosine phosphatase